MAKIKTNSTEELGTQELALITRLSNAEKELVQKQEQFAIQLAEIKQKEAAVKELREKLIPILSKQKIVDENGKYVAPYIENDFVRFSLVRGYDKVVLDEKQFQAVEPKLYAELLDKYSKHSSRKDTVKLTFKKIKIESE